MHLYGLDYTETPSGISLPHSWTVLIVVGGYNGKHIRGGSLILQREIVRQLVVWMDYGKLMIVAIESRFYVNLVMES